MKLLGLIIVATSVSCQQVKVFYNSNRGTVYRGYKCHKDLDGKVDRVEVSRGDEVQFFRTRDCSRGYIYRARGNFDLGETINYRSLKVLKKGSRSSSSDGNVVVLKANDADDASDDNGGEKGESVDSDDE